MRRDQRGVGSGDASVKGCKCGTLWLACGSLWDGLRALEGLVGCGCGTTDNRH
jgi:hypothetical protein